MAEVEFDHILNLMTSEPICMSSLGMCFVKYDHSSGKPTCPICMVLLDLWGDKVDQEFKEKTMPIKYIDEMPWAKPFRKRCKEKLKRKEDPAFRGRCELQPGHMDLDPPVHHCLERGMIWVFWDKNRNIRYEGPTYKRVVVE